MKITLFGLTISSSWGNGHATPYRAILKALHRRGHKVTFYEKDVAFYALRRDFSACESCELILYSKWQDVRARALNDVRNSDVVVNASYCADGAWIIDEVLAINGPLHAFYDLDTPITLAKLECCDLEYLRRDQIPEFSLYLSFTGGSILGELENRWGAQCARPLYGCVDPEVHSRVPARREFECLLSYMGTYAADRQEKLDALFLEPARRLAHEPFLLAGSLYPGQWRWPENIQRFDHVAPTDHRVLYSSSRATLNITRAGMARSGYCPSGRFFEAAACATPIISDYFEGIETFFTPGEEIILAETADDVVTALSQPDGELERIAAAAHARTLADHTGDRRAEQFLAYIAEAPARWARSEVA